MSKLSYREVIKRLRKSGSIFVRQGNGSHEIWKNPNTGRAFVEPCHTKGFTTKTLTCIVKQAGFKNLKEFQDFL